MAGTNSLPASSAGGAPATSNGGPAAQATSITSAPAAQGPQQQQAALGQPPPAAALPDGSLESLESLDRPQLVSLARELHAAVGARDALLLQQAGAAARLQEQVAGLQEANEQLALRSQRINEQDWEEMRRECEQRLATAERKVRLRLEEFGFSGGVTCGRGVQWGRAHG